MCYSSTMKQCDDCKKEFDGRGTTCSACRVRQSRERKKGADVPIRPVPPKELTGTDKLFNDAHPGYYIFSPESYDRACVLCGDKFTTSLELLKFCSPDCQKQVMVVIANGPHKNYKR